MNIFRIAKTFRKDEDGAVTVDWVVLTAAIVGLAVVVGSQVMTKTQVLGQEISTKIGGAAAQNDYTIN